MTVSTIIDRILGKQRERQSVRLADFNDVVRQIADGKDPDADEVDAILHDAEKSLDDLREAVEDLQLRRDLKAKVDRLPKLAARRQDIERQIAEANRVLEQAEERHVTVTSPLEMHLQDLKEQIWAGEQAKGELHRTCTDVRLREQLNEVLAKAAEKREEAASLRDAIDRRRRLAQADREQADRLVFDSRSGDLRRQADEHDAEVARLQAQLKAAEKQAAAMEKQEQAIRDEMLAP